MYYPQESPTYLQLSLCVSSNLQCHNKENSLYPEFFQRESLLYPKKSLSREYTSLKDYGNLDSKFLPNPHSLLNSLPMAV